MEKYIKLFIGFIIGYALALLPPTIEPFFLFKIYIGSNFSDLEMYIIRILNIIGIMMIFYTSIIVIKNLISNK